MVEITAKDNIKNCTFENLILNVDGVRQSLNFSTPVNHIFSEGNIFTEQSKNQSVVKRSLEKNIYNTNG